MTYAPIYNRLYNFTNFQATSPTTPLPASQVDAELSQIKISLDGTQQNLALIQKNDGTLSNNSVGPLQLQSGVALGFTFRGPWNAASAYEINDNVSYGYKMYVSNTVHTSAVTPDVDTTNWRVGIDFTGMADPALSIDTYGGDPTGATYSDAAIAPWLAAMRATGRRGRASAGTYQFASPVLFDVAVVLGKGYKFDGAGVNATTFNYAGASFPAFRVGTDSLGVSAFTRTGGSGYTTGTYTNVALTGGSGSGARATVTVAGGVVTAVAITAAGVGYVNGNVLTASAASIGGTGTGFSITLTSCRGDNFYTQIKGITFTASVAGPVFQIGRDDMADPINGGDFDINTNNGSTNSAAEGLRVNGAVTCAIRAVSSNNSGPAGLTPTGKAWAIRGAAMTNFSGSAAGAAVGVYLTATTYQNVFGNNFLAIDMEVNTKCVLIDAAGGGTAPLKNTFIGGQYGYSAYAIDAQAGSNNLFINGNLGAVNDFLGKVGITAIGPSYDTFVKDAWATLGLTAVDSVIHCPAGTASSGIAANTNGNSFAFQNVTDGTGYVANYATDKLIIYQTTGAAGAHEFFANNVLQLVITPLKATFSNVVQLKSTTVGALPAAATYPGAIAWVTDAAAPAWNAALTGGGAVGCLAKSNGTTWVAG